MKPFVAIARPHKDIRQGKLEMDVFAADLWRVYKGQAPKEYGNPDVFFRKTYLTAGLKNLIDVAFKRIKGQGGDSVIQLQTPFGGGKTHGLIALYHKAKEWNTNVVVLDGLALDPRTTKLWEEIESQLSGSVSKLKGDISPGKDRIIEFLVNHRPLIVLMDEILSYATKAAGVKIGDSNLAAQTLVFLQELSGAVSALGDSLMVVTLASSSLEHFDETAERIFQQLQKVFGRIEKVYTPVRDEEIELVIKQRLFSYVDEKEAEKVVNEFVDYATKEGLIPEDESYSYREQFLKSYPFQPEVISVLYKRWGSIPNFQRTRGVLRLLSLVVFNLQNTQRPYIRLGDFDLADSDIRRELLKYIGPEYDAVIAHDIISPDSGAKKVDKELGDSYRPYSLGTSTATTIFMLSFSGGPERGGTIQEIKISSVDFGLPSSIIDTTINKLREKLFYLADEGLYFNTEPNLKKKIVEKTESIGDTEILSEEENILHNSFSRQKFKIFIWPSNPSDVPDSKDLKLVVLKDPEKVKEFLYNYGERPRVYRNTLFFLCPKESEEVNFRTFIKEFIAWKDLYENMEHLLLSDTKKRIITENIKRYKEDALRMVRSYYRLLYIPSSKAEVKIIDLGMPIGGKLSIDLEVYDRLRSEHEILEKLSHFAINEKYLKNRKWIRIREILEAFYKTPGELRLISEEAIIYGIRIGVKEGLFGLGYVRDNEVVCSYFKQECTPQLSEEEVLIHVDLCKKQKEEVSKPQEEATKGEFAIAEGAEEELHKERIEKGYSSILLKIKVPSGKLADIARLAQYLRRRFQDVELRIELFARGGKLTKTEYEDKVRETLNQTGVEVEEEKIE